jgi:glycosyltransferase involved in cell wall biosynthesis
MTRAVIVDLAGAGMGGAARFATELRRYLSGAQREDVRVIGAEQRVGPKWLLRREVAGRGLGRRVALNNVSFISPGGERWALLRNALHFLTEDETRAIDPSLRGATGREAAIVRLYSRRADVLVVPSTAMAERVSRILPGAQRRIVVRPHPVSADAIPRLPRDPAAILCPVLFAPYKQMTRRLTDLLAAIEEHGDPTVHVRVTADRVDVTQSLAANPRIQFLGRLDQDELRNVWGRSRALYFPTDLESFGYPLAEARVSGQPVIALDTAQNREIAGPALRGFSDGDHDSLVRAVALALTVEVAPDPGAFDPAAYFTWMLGAPR